MELTRKQLILIAAVSGAILLLTVAAVLICTPGEEEALAEPTASPTLTASPLPTPEPTAAPSPTVLRLPLVPQWDTPQPSGEPAGAGVFAPQTLVPEGTAGPWVDAGDGHTRDILAVGLREGRAAALLLLRLSGNTLTVLALPADEGLLAGADLTGPGEEAASKVKALTGLCCGSWMALDLACLPMVLEITGPLGDPGTDVLSMAGIMAMAEGAVTYVQRVSLLKLPALKRAMGDCFRSNMSTWDLWRFFWTVRGGVEVRSKMLSVERVQADRKFF